MENEWRVEEYRGMDVYVLVSPQGQGSIGRWGYEVRVSQEGADPADAGDTELLASGPQQFATRHAAEVAAFGAGYALVDRLLGPVEQSATGYCDWRDALYHAVIYRYAETMLAAHEPDGKPKRGA